MEKVCPRGDRSEQLTRFESELIGISQVRVGAASWKCRIEPQDCTRSDPMVEKMLDLAI